MAPKSLKYLLPAAQSSSNTESGCICAPFPADALDAALLATVLRKFCASLVYFLNNFCCTRNPRYDCIPSTLVPTPAVFVPYLACVGSSSRAHFVNSCDRCIIVQGQVTLQACRRQFTGPMLAVLECIHRT